MRDTPASRRCVGGCGMGGLGGCNKIAALKGCRSIVFTHGVQMGGGAVGWVLIRGEKFVRAVYQKLSGIGS